MHAPAPAQPFPGSFPDALGLYVALHFARFGTHQADTQRQDAHPVGGRVNRQTLALRKEP